jgi:hypothetical protein
MANCSIPRLGALQVVMTAANQGLEIAVAS